MVEFDHMVSNQRKWMLCLLGFFILGFILTPYRNAFLGLFFGGVISLINLFLLHAQGKKFAKAVIGEGNFMMIGPFLRLLIVCATLFLAYKFANTVLFWSMVIGLVTSYFVMIGDVFMRSLLEVKNQK